MGIRPMRAAELKRSPVATPGPPSAVSRDVLSQLSRNCSLEGAAARSLLV